MRVLLINSNRCHQPWPVIPFGLGCVAAAVERAAHDVSVLDLCFSRDPGKEIRYAIESFSPDIIGISVRNIDNATGYNTIFLLDDVRRDVIIPCRQAFAGPIVIGGAAVGINGAEILDFFDLELAIRGDGESAMVELLARMENNRSLEGIPGLVRRFGGLLVEDNAAAAVDNLDDQPTTGIYDHIDLDLYRRFDSPIQVQSKRGCPLSCTYCTYNRIEGRRWRLRDPQRVADDIEILVRKTGIRHIEFTDSTFNIPLDHCKAVLRAVANKGLDLRIQTMGLNPGAVDEELVELMWRAGLREIDLGAESCCDRTLAGLGKCFGREDVLRAAALLKSRGIAIMWCLLVGGPGETEETLRETFDTVNKAADPWDLVDIGIGLRVYNGSPVAEGMRQEDPSCTADNFLKPIAYRGEGLSLRRLKWLVKLEALRRTNYFMYDEDENIPPFVQMLGVEILKLVAPGNPIWRLFILIRRLQKMLGINAILLLAHKFAGWRHAKPRATAGSQATEQVAGERTTGSWSLRTENAGWVLDVCPGVCLVGHRLEACGKDGAVERLAPETMMESGKVLTVR